MFVVLFLSLLLLWALGAMTKHHLVPHCTNLYHSAPPSSTDTISSFQEALSTYIQKAQLGQESKFVHLKQSATPVNFRLRIRANANGHAMATTGKMTGGP